MKEFEDRRWKLEEGATRLSVGEAVQQIIYDLQDFQNGISGHNSIKDPQLHPNEKEMNLDIEAIISRLTNLRKNDTARHSKFWFRRLG